MGKSSHDLIEKKFIGGLTENLNELLKCIEWRTGVLDMSGLLTTGGIVTWEMTSSGCNY